MSQRDPNAVQQTPEFFAEAGEIVDHIQAVVSQIDVAFSQGHVAPGLINELFRHAHSIKGLAGVFEVEALVELAHAFEDLLHSFRLGKIEITPASIIVMEQTGDALLGVLQSVEQGGDPPQGLDLLAKSLLSLSQGLEIETHNPVEDVDIPKEIRSVLTEYEEHRLAENVRQNIPLYFVLAVLDMGQFDTILAAISEHLQAIGELLTTLPGMGAPDGFIEFKLLFATERPQSEWESLIQQQGARIEVQSIGIKEALAQKLVKAEAQAIEETPLTEVNASIGESIRVDLRKLDALMGVVGELSLVRAEVSQAFSRLRDVEGAHFLAMEMQRTSRAFERHLSELQQGIMNVRMVPLRVVFKRLTRTARHIARELDKDVRVIISGEDTELDKVLIEELTDPLNHLMRNAIDHGIENLERREAAGKAPYGTVYLRAFPKGRHVVIEVADDGAGLDLVSIRRAALDAGLVDEDKVGSLSPAELHSFIFLPGFSTSHDVTEISGRGVGMDVVKTNISRLSGMIHVNSQPGQGSVFTLTLPMTLAIVQALIVQVNAQRYALPLASVQEIRILDQKEVRTIEGREVIFGREETIPLLWVARRLGQEFATESLDESQEQVERHVVIVGFGEQRVGLIVDGLHGQQDIVVKSMGKIMRDVPGISGATDLGAQGLLLVLDVAGLVSGSRAVTPSGIRQKSLRSSAS